MNVYLLRHVLEKVNEAHVDASNEKYNNGNQSTSDMQATHE